MKSYVHLKMGHELKGIFMNLPIQKFADETLVGYSLLISAIIGLAVFAIGLSGLGRRCSGANEGKRAERRMRRAKRFMIFFIFLYIGKVLIDISIVSGIGEKLEVNIDKFPEIAKKHNIETKIPHIVLIYKNGTSMFAVQKAKQPQNMRQLPIKGSPNIKPSFERKPKNEIKSTPAIIYRTISLQMLKLKFLIKKCHM